MRGLFFPVVGVAEVSGLFAVNCACSGSNRGSADESQNSHDGEYYGRHHGGEQQVAAEKFKHPKQHAAKRDVDVGDFPAFFNHLRRGLAAPLSQCNSALGKPKNQTKHK